MRTHPRTQESSNDAAERLIAESGGNQKDAIHQARKNQISDYWFFWRQVEREIEEPPARSLW